MRNRLFHQLASRLANSDAELRKHWASRVVDEEIPLESLLSLFHADQKTAQRFMWLVGDICKLRPGMISPSMPLLFSLRDQMPFPGMDRSVAVWLFLTGVPDELGAKAIEQLFQWMETEEASIACKSFSAKALFLLVEQGRTSRARLFNTLTHQTSHNNKAYRSRMQKLLAQL